MQRLKSLVLETERLIIRPAIIGDLPGLLDVHSQDAVNRFIPYDTWQDPSDAQDWYDYVEERRARNFAEHFVIIEKATNDLIGGCLAFDYIEALKQVEIGYVLSEKFWGQAYMSEALRTFLPGVQARLKTKQLLAKVDPQNQASIHLLKALKFKQDHAQSDADTTVMILRDKEI